MRFIEPSAEIVKETNPLKKIEIAGRTCYKSEDSITETSHEDFYSKMVKSGHYAMLEHGTFILKLKEPDRNMDVWDSILKVSNDENHLKFINVSRMPGIDGAENCIISGNLRALNEMHRSEILTALYVHNPKLVYSDPLFVPEFENMFTVMTDEEISELSDIERNMHTYTTIKFVCDRGVSHEIVRHRPASYAQESTRYVNYSKQDGIVFIRPSTYDEWPYIQQFGFENNLRSIEEWYCAFTGDFAGAQGIRLQPQQARALLPNCLKTEIIMTASGIEWEHFFNLRTEGTSGKPHPDMKKVAGIAYELYKEYTGIS